jgi:type IV secretory pathway protease TraF
MIDNGKRSKPITLASSTYAIAVTSFSCIVSTFFMIVPLLKFNTASSPLCAHKTIPFTTVIHEHDTVVVNKEQRHAYLAADNHFSVPIIKAKASDGRVHSVPVRF